MAPDGRARNGSTHGTRNGFHRRKRNFVGSARQRKSRGDPYGADLVLQAAPPLDLVRMQEADRGAPWHRRFKHWVFRTETRTFPAVPDNGKVRIIRVCGAGTRERLRPYFSIHPLIEARSASSSRSTYSQIHMVKVAIHYLLCINYRYLN